MKELTPALHFFTWAKPPPFMYYWRELIELWYSNKWFYKYLSGVNSPLWDMQSSWSWSYDLFLESSKIPPALRQGCSIVRTFIYEGVGRRVTTIQAAIRKLQRVLRKYNKSQLLNTHSYIHKKDKCLCQAETGALCTLLLLDHVNNKTCKWSAQASVIFCFTCTS